MSFAAGEAGGWGEKLLTETRIEALNEVALSKGEGSLRG
jgi:hypothetical protein